MNKDKQIEETTRIASKCITSWLNNETSKVLPDYIAEAFCTAGYRKASEIVRDIFNDLNEMWHKGHGFINYSDLVRLERLHEQKYTEEKKNV